MGSAGRLDNVAPGLEVYYLRYRDAVYRWSMQFCGGRVAAAQDITQDVFIRLFDNLSRLTDHGDLGGWLYRVTANLCRTRTARERSWIEHFSRIFSAGQEDSLSPDFETQGQARAALEAVRYLPDRPRTAFCMKVMDGKSQREVARHMGVSEALVSRWLASAWQQIRASGWEVDDEQS